MIIQNERLKWMEQLLLERFGQRWQLKCVDNKLKMQLAELPGQIVFNCLEPAFMKVGKPSELGFEWWRVESPWKSVLDERSLPSPTARRLPQPLIEQCDEGTVCHYDILGLAFWAMNRLEEVNSGVLDEHKRFPASESHAVQNKYLDRPLVDEWFSILAQIIKCEWPGIQLKKHQFQLVLSHDVDRPSRYGFRNMRGLVKAVGGGMLNHRDILALLKGPWIRLNSRQSLHPMDPYNTFHWLMEQSDNVGVKSTFNFICEHTSKKFDGDYNIDHPAIRKLIKEIHKKGHYIGLHPSYDAYLIPGQIKREFEKLKRVCKEEDITQSEWGVRMHFLRGKQPTTWVDLDNAGLNYDSTIAHAADIGFKAGTCFSYSPFDILGSKQLCIREKPMIVMERSLLAQKYMNFKNDIEALNYVHVLKKRCEKVSGEFVVLWHNCELWSNKSRKLYQKVLKLQ